MTRPRNTGDSTPSIQNLRIATGNANTHSEEVQRDEAQDDISQDQDHNGDTEAEDQHDKDSPSSSEDSGSPLSEMSSPQEMSMLHNLICRNWNIAHSADIIEETNSQTWLKGKITRDANGQVVFDLDTIRGLYDLSQVSCNRKDHIKAHLAKRWRSRIHNHEGFTQGVGKTWKDKQVFLREDLEWLRGHVIDGTEPLLKPRKSTAAPTRSQKKDEALQATEKELHDGQRLDKYVEETGGTPNEVQDPPHPHPRPTGPQASSALTRAPANHTLSPNTHHMTYCQYQVSEAHRNLQLAEERRMVAGAQERIAYLNRATSQLALAELGEAVAKAEQEVAQAKRILGERRKDMLLRRAEAEGDPYEDDD